MSGASAAQGVRTCAFPTRGPANKAEDGAGGAEPALPRIGALESMDRGALLALWASVIGGVPPSKLSQPLMRRILAWELQARKQIGLPAAVKRKLESLAAAQASGKEKPIASPKLRPGGRLLREWNGVTHVVDVVEGGFLWRGERHRSLSAIARAITGAHWSGPRFFGLLEGAGKAGEPKKKSARVSKEAEANGSMPGGAGRQTSAAPAGRRSA